MWGFHLGSGGGNRRFLLSLLYNSLKSLKRSSCYLQQQKPSGDLPRQLICPSIQQPLCFVFFATDLAAGRLQKDTCCRFSFFVEENASNSDEGCSSRRWVRRKCGDFQGFEVFHLVYRPKPHDSPLWKLPKRLSIVSYLQSVVGFQLLSPLHRSYSYLKNYKTQHAAFSLDQSLHSQ